MEERTPESWLELFHSAFVSINLDNPEKLIAAEKAKKIILAEISRKTVQADWFKKELRKFPIITVEKGKKIDYSTQGAEIFTYLINLLIGLGFKIRKA